jgi:hypothetical protein
MIFWTEWCKEILSNESAFNFAKNIILLRAGIAQSVYRLAMGWTAKGSDFESRWGQEFLLLYVVQTGSGVHPTSHPMGTGVSVPEVKRQVREADHSPPASAEVKKMWIYTSTLPYTFMA